MPRLLVHITLFVLLTLTCSCRDDSYDRQMSQAIGLAQTLVDSLPDSTLTILNTIDIDALGSNKARAYYLAGCAKLRMQNFPNAMWSLLNAEKLSARREDYKLLTLTRLKMMELADSLYDRKSKHEYALAAVEAYDLLTAGSDSLTDIIGPDGEPVDFQRIISKSSSLSPRAGAVHTPAGRGPRSNKFFAVADDSSVAVNRHAPDSTQLSMSDLHTIINRMWDSGDDRGAQRLLNNYIHCYNPGDPAACKSLSDCRCSNPGSETESASATHINRIITRRHIMESFQRETSDAVAKFNYGESLLKDQTLRLHRIHLWLSICLIVVLIAVIFLIIRLNRSQRLRREEESMHTALELQNALSSSKNRCLNTLTHLCNTYYEGFNRESVKSKAAKEALEAIKEFADSPEFFAYLESRLNMECYGLMSRFRSEMPDLREADYRLYLCNALGLSIPTICLLLKEKREVIYNRRLRMRTKIQTSGSTDTETFLQYLR